MTKSAWILAIVLLSGLTAGLGFFVFDRGASNLDSPPGGAEPAVADPDQDATTSDPESMPTQAFTGRDHQLTLLWVQPDGQAVQGLVGELSGHEVHRLDPSDAAGKTVQRIPQEWTARRSLKLELRDERWAADPLDLDFLEPGGSSAYQVRVRPRDQDLNVLVLDEAGLPVADAAIHGDGIPDPDAQTDADGQYSLKVPSRGPARLIGTRTPAGIRIEERVEAGRREVTLRFPRFRRIEGIFESATGQPLPQAGVLASSAREICFAAVRTDDAGRFQLDLPLGKGEIVIHASRDDLAARLPVVSVRDLPAQITLRAVEVTRERARVRVRHPEHGPLAGARVIVHGLNAFARPRVGYTDAQGQFTVVHRAPSDGDLQVIAQWGELAALHGRWNPSEQPQITLALEPATWIDGTIRNDAGQLLEGALIYEAGWTDTRTYSDANGAFRLGPFPRPVQSLNVRAQHPLTGSVTAPLASDTRNAQINLPRAWRYVGQVRSSESDAPLTQFELHLSAPGEGPPLFNASVSHPEGRFAIEIPGEAGAGPLVVNLVAPGRKRASWNNVFPESNPLAPPQVYRLDPGRVVRGRVVMVGEASFGRDALVARVGDAATAVSKNGDFKLAGLPRGDAVILITVRELPLFSMALERDANTIDLGELRVPAPGAVSYRRPPGATNAGRLALRHESLPWSLEVDVGAAVRVAPIPAGPVNLTLRTQDGEVEQRVEVPAGLTLTVDGQGKRMAICRGQVLTDDGKPAKGAELVLRGTDPQAEALARGRCDDQGNFDLGAFPPGEYRLELRFQVGTQTWQAREALQLDAGRARYVVRLRRQG